LRYGRRPPHLGRSVSVTPVHLADPPEGDACCECIAEFPCRSQNGGRDRIPGRGDEWREKRRGSEVGDAEAVSDEVAARLEFRLDAVDSGSNLRAGNLASLGVDVEPPPQEGPDTQEQRTEEEAGARPRPEVKNAAPRAAESGASKP
jgi:hypothetical protein